MTGCLYVSPAVVKGDPTSGVLPTVLADVMVTFKSPPEGAIKKLPSTFTARDETKFSSTRLARKLNIIQNTAVAFAGDGIKIAHCLHEIQHQLDDWKKSDRPMRNLGDIANRIGIEAIGIHPIEPPGSGINSMMYSVDFDLPNLGMGGAIGSGRDDILKRCHEFEGYLDKFPDGAPVYAKIIGFCNALAASRLADEIIGQAENSWGGYVESACWNSFKNCWVRGPKVAHFFLFVPEIRNSTAQAFLVPRVVAYDPGDAHGRLLSLAFEEDGQSSGAADFVIESLISAVAPPDPADFWPGWRPDCAVVTMILPDPSGKPLHITKTIDGPLARELIWQIDFSEMRIGFTETSAVTLKRELLSAVGVGLID